MYSRNVQMEAASQGLTDDVAIHARQEDNPEAQVID